MLRPSATCIFTAGRRAQSRRTFAKAHPRTHSKLTSKSSPRPGLARALASGEVDRVPGALCKEWPEKPGSQSTSGSRARGRTRKPFAEALFAIRLWPGCPSLFFNLSPQGVRSPLAISLAQGGARFEQQFSFDWAGDDAESYITSLVAQSPRALQEAVAGNRLASTRIFHGTARLVFAHRVQLRRRSR